MGQSAADEADAEGLTPPPPTGWEGRCCAASSPPEQPSTFNRTALNLAAEYTDVTVGNTEVVDLEAGRWCS
jgi:hypothetical protein